jgi:hypothetical protein
MTGASLSVVSLGAGMIIRCLHELFRRIDEFSSTSPQSAGHPHTHSQDNPTAFTVLMENEHGAKQINFQYKTNPADSPTRRLINFKGIQGKSSLTGSKQGKIAAVPGANPR